MDCKSFVLILSAGLIIVAVFAPFFQTEIEEEKYYCNDLTSAEKGFYATWKECENYCNERGLTLKQFASYQIGCFERSLND